MNMWTLAGSKSQGSSHVRANIVCQDAFEYLASSDGQWAAIVVSDGAGSAARAEEGSALVSRYLAKKLIELSEQFNNRVPGAWINDFVIEQVLEVRNLLRKTAKSDNIQDFHSTLVACLVGPNGGFTIHIGDGAILSGVIKSNQLGDSDSATMQLTGFSKPENGEYSNETFFITEGDWIKHIRISPIGDVDWIALGTDGGSALFLENETSPNELFLSTFFQTLLLQPSHLFGNFINQNLISQEADKLSSDDKTLVVCIRERALQFTGKQLNFEGLSQTVEPAKPISQPTAIAQGINTSAKQDKPQAVPENQIDEVKIEIKKKEPKSTLSKLLRKISSYLLFATFIFTLTTAAIHSYLLKYKGIDILAEQGKKDSPPAAPPPTKSVEGDANPKKDVSESSPEKISSEKDTNPSKQQNKKSKPAK